MLNDDPAFPRAVRAIRFGRWYITKTVGTALDFVIFTLEESEQARPHWALARAALYEALPDGAAGLPRPGQDKVEAARVAFSAAMKKERWLHD